MSTRIEMLMDNLLTTRRDLVADETEVLKQVEPIRAQIAEIDNAIVALQKVTGIKTDRRGRRKGQTMNLSDEGRARISEAGRARAERLKALGLHLGATKEQEAAAMEAKRVGLAIAV